MCGFLYAIYPHSLTRVTTLRRIGMTHEMLDGSNACALLVDHQAGLMLFTGNIELSEIHCSEEAHHAQKTTC
jgi:hypothetical protein